MISLDYSHVLMAAAGHAAEAALEEAMETHRGNYILAVEGNPPLNEDGMFCIVGGRPFVEKLKEPPPAPPPSSPGVPVRAMAACRRPSPTRPRPPHPQGHYRQADHQDPRLPSIAEVMTGVITYMLTFGRLPELDRQGRPAMFYGQRIHDKCYRRPHFDAGQFVEPWDDDNARKGYCLYKMGCKGPTTYNACSTVGWNEGTSFPIQSGHGCIGCSRTGSGTRALSTTGCHHQPVRDRGECRPDGHGRRRRGGRRGRGPRRCQRPEARAEKVPEKGGGLSHGDRNTKRLHP